MSWSVMVKGSTWNAWGSPLNGFYGIIFDQYQFLTTFAGCGAVRKQWVITKQESGYSVSAIRTPLEFKRGLNERKSEEIKFLLKKKWGLKVEGKHVSNLWFCLRSWSGAVIPLSVSRWSLESAFSKNLATNCKPCLLQTSFISASLLLLDFIILLFCCFW